MSSSEREESRDRGDRELVLRHHPSVSDSGRAPVPMWDSSDPDRAPPPLPLNPTTSSPTTKPNTSKAVAAAAEALTAKARESAYTINPLPQKSPEKSLIKGQHHKRLQSLQNGSRRDKSNYTDALSSLDKSPEKLPERLLRGFGSDIENRSPERSPTRSSTPTPIGRDIGKDALGTKPTRPPLRPILGENTPPSSTMLALQSMAASNDNTPLTDVTNGSTPNIRNPQTFDAISSQILSLTTIATSLQREMAQLSRRSKDNATDLVSLKEATNSRDEDIRKSLKDLVFNLSSKILEPSEQGSRTASNYSRGPAGLFLDSKAHDFGPGMTKSYSQPRMGSPGFNSSDLSSSSYNIEGAASIALLEKILRDMGTKEGQDKVTDILSELRNQSELEKRDPMVVQKLEEILNFLKDSTGSRALVSQRGVGDGAGNAPPKLVLDFDPKPAPLRVSKELTPKRETVAAGTSPRGPDFLTEDFQKLLKKMKDSISEGGGMTAEVKANLRELRGEVLGMGRDIARKLDQAESAREVDNGAPRDRGHDEITQIVQQGLSELKDVMEIHMRENRRQSSSSIVSRPAVDSQEVYAVVKNALAEYPLQQQVALHDPKAGIEREEIVETIKQAWESYRPEIEMEHFGLERDEILQCLKEGLQQYQPQHEAREVGGVGYEEVLDAVREGLQDFKPPAPVESEMNFTREEILMAVRECLENFEFPTSSVGAPRELEMTRDDVLDAVKEGFVTQAHSKEIEFNREDLFDAVKAGLESAPTPMGGVGEKVLDKMEEIIDGMRVEFKQYSEANGGDTEQVLDALKDGLEVLRNDIESYVDRAADVTGKDEIIDSVKDGLEHLRADLENSIANNARNPAPSNNVELLDAMEKEFEHLRQTIASTMIRSGGEGPDREEVLDVIREGLAGMGTNVPRQVNSDDNVETIQVMREEFEHLRGTLATTLVRGGDSLEKEEMLEAIREGHENLRAELESKHERPESVISNTGELLDALNDGLDGLRVDVERMVNKPLDMTLNYEILETLKEGLANVRADVDRLHASNSGQHGFTTSRDGEVVVADSETQSLQRNDIGNLEMMITQLRMKVEAMDNMPPPTQPAQASDSVLRDQMEGLEGILRDVHAAVGDNNRTDISENVATKDDTDAIETLLRNTKAKIDEIGSTEAEGLARVSHFESLESILHEARDAVHEYGSEGATKKDFGVLEALLKEVSAGLGEIRERGIPQEGGEKVSKTDIEALETLCMDMKTQIEDLPLPDIETLPTKTEMGEIGDLVRQFHEQAQESHNLTGQAFEARKTEHAGLADKIEDVKLIFEDVREELKAKMEEGHTSVREVAETLEAVGENVAAIDSTATVGEILEIVKREFQAVHDASDQRKEQHEQNHAIILGKHTESKDAVVKDLSTRLDARFDEIMTKYDDAQLAAQEKELALDGKNAHQEAALNATKAAAEELKALADTLGSTITESCDRMDEDSKTVFNRVEEVSTKIDELLISDGKAEHQATRAEISRALAGVEGIQAHANEYHPRILDAVKDVLGIVGMHYEQAKTSTAELMTSVQGIPEAIPLPTITSSAPDPDLIREAPVHEKYDDSAVHTKLDQLVANVAEAKNPQVEVETLEQIREQVAATSTQLNEFIEAQQAATAELNIARSKEAEEAAIALEKRTAQKENVEADIVRLSAQKAGLGQDVDALFRQKDDLAALKSKMQADLSSLETALQIRREELHIMEARADGLERRILDGVLDHSRSLLTTSRPPSSLKEMNLKRVASTASNASAATRASINTTVPSIAPSAVTSGIGMALKRRQPPRTSATNSVSSRPDRRILSLSTLGANKGERSMVLADSSIAGGMKKGSGLGAGGLKRSHSVKSNFPVRKTSWGGTRALGMYGDDGTDDGEDKENSILDEKDEEGLEERSEAGTERRTSYSGTYTGSESYGDGSTAYSGDDKRTSCAASTIGTVGVRDFAITEDGHSDDDDGLAEEEGGEGSARDEDFEDDGSLYDGHKEPYEEGDRLAGPKGEVGNAGEMIVFGHPSDSGIGTDMPTAQIEGGSDYFRR